MQSSLIFRPLGDIGLGIRIAFVPTLLDIIRSPLLLFQPKKLSQTFFAHLWKVFGDGIDENSHPTKEDLVPRAEGVVLELGAGYGHTAGFLDKSKVTTYVALEPNKKMHDGIRRKAASFGFSESPKGDEHPLILLDCGAEDTTAILKALNEHKIDQVDTILTILTFCSIPNPHSTLKALVGSVLKSGGHFLFFEHVRSHLPHVARWQWFWSPLWCRFFDGCRLDIPTDTLLDELDLGDGKVVWAKKNIWSLENEPLEHLWWHQIGDLVKA